MATSAGPTRTSRGSSSASSTTSRPRSAERRPVGVLTARVVPDLSGLDKIFDYAVPDGLDVRLGDLVRIPLAGRRVGGWVVRLSPADADAPVDDLKPIAKVTGRGPD